MVIYRLLKLKVPALQACAELSHWMFAPGTSAMVRMDYVRNLPREIDLAHEDEPQLEKLFDYEVLPDAEAARWEPPVNPARTALTSHLALFKQGLALGGLSLDPAALTALIASTEQALDTMHGIPWAG